MQIAFTAKCCIYKDVSYLLNDTHQYLELITKYLQSFRYFDEYRENILDILKIDEKIMTKADQLAMSMDVTNEGETD